MNSNVRGGFAEFVWCDPVGFVQTNRREMYTFTLRRRRDDFNFENTLQMISPEQRSGLYWPRAPFLTSARPIQHAFE